MERDLKSEGRFLFSDLSAEAQYLVSFETYSFISGELDKIRSKVVSDGMTPEITSRLKVIQELVLWYRDNYFISAKYLLEKLNECKKSVRIRKKEGENDIL